MQNRTQQTPNRIAARADAEAATAATPDGPALAGHSFAALSHAPPVQRQAEPIQRDDDAPPANWGVNLDPPQVAGPIGPLSGSAGVSHLQLSLPWLLNANAQLGYDGTLTGGVSGSGWEANAGGNPFTGSLALNGKWNGFNGSATYQPGGAFTGSLGYGSPLLPMPWDLGTSMQGGVGDVTGALGNLTDAAHDGHGSLPFGAGFQVQDDPQHGFYAGVGIQGTF